MLGQRRRRWTSIKPALRQRLVFAWEVSDVQTQYLISRVGS